MSYDRSSLTRFSLFLTIRTENIPELRNALRDKQIRYRINSRQKFAPMSPEQLLEIVFFIGSASYDVIRNLVIASHKSGAIIELESHEKIAKQIFKKKWPYQTVKAVQRTNYVYLEFKKGKKRFCYECKDGQIKAGDIS